MVNVESLQTIIDLIQGRFRKKFTAMDFFFIHRFRQEKTLLTVHRGLPALLFKVTDTINPDVSFETTYITDKERVEKQNTNISRRGYRGLTRNIVPEQVSWEDIDPYESRRHNYLAHTFCKLTRVREILLYEWGFEILTADALELSACESSALENFSSGAIAEMCGKPFKVIPLGPMADTEIENKWQFGAGSSDDFTERIKKMLRSDEKAEETPNLGQATRQLLLDGDDI